MRSYALVTVAAVALAFAGAGCEKPPAASVTASPSANTATAILPASYFSSTPPADAVKLIDAKASAKAGDRVVFEARVGGRRKPFVENRAVFFVIDPVLPSCDALPGDGCKTPWDYCCEPRDNLTKHMATVQFVGDDGKPLKVNIEPKSGIEPLKTIFVTGVVAEADDAGTFVVNAETIYVVEG